MQFVNVMMKQAVGGFYVHYKKWLSLNNQYRLFGQRSVKKPRGKLQQADEKQ